MKFHEHKSYLGFANEMPNDNRIPAWEKQYNEWGFDDTVTWSLDDSLIKWFTPRLRRFLEISEEITDAPDFHKDVEEMLKGFDLYLSGSFNEFDKEHIQQLNKSFELLTTSHRGLWW